MSKFFTKFPTIQYDIAGYQYKNYQNVTNIFYRLRILRSVLSNISTYYTYIVKDYDTPEILADKVYGDSEAHWIILLANDMIDAKYDWPMNETVFGKYIIGKYGSIENAQTTIHHYEKVIRREESASGTLTETRFIVNQQKLTVNDMTVPYDTFATLALTQEVNTYNMGNGKTVHETIDGDAITNYDYEFQLNEQKRTIKIIKQDYYPQILYEFNNITNANKNIPYIRKLV